MSLGYHNTQYRPQIRLAVSECGWIGAGESQCNRSGFDCATSCYIGLSSFLFFDQLLQRFQSDAQPGDNQHDLSQQQSHFKVG